MNERIRAKNLPTNNVGAVRWELYKRAIERWHNAFEKGFYLECIVITDSMIADRLEARRSFLLGKDADNVGTFQPIGNTLRRLAKEETSDDKKLIEAIEKVSAWVDLRNKAIPRLVKVNNFDLDKTFDDKIAEYRKTALEGFEAHKKLSAAVKRLNKY